MIFQKREVKLSSGKVSSWKCDCDYLDWKDLETMAHLAKHLIPDYGLVIPVPTGGFRFASELQAYREYRNGEQPLVLIADDVLTSGGSMERMRECHPDARGIVMFARGPLPDWVESVWTLNPKLVDL